MIVVNNIRLAPKHTETDIKNATAKKLCTTADNIEKIKIIRKSIDARKTPLYIYSVAAKLYDYSGVSGEEYKEIKPLKVLHRKFAKRPVIAGFGPAGMFAALLLAQSGAEPLVLERGKCAGKRKEDIKKLRKCGILNVNSNIQFGEGGAGMFSDGKLATGISSPYIKNVFKTFVEMGAQEEILYSAKPHIGSDILPSVVENIRKEIERLGGEIRFSSKLDDIITENGRISAAVSDGTEIPTDTLLLSVGHSARDTFEMLNKSGVAMALKPFAVGCRIEHLQKDINAAQYGKSADLFPPADYKLSCHLKNGFSVYTFCMCPGGYVVNSSSEADGTVTNGYSESRRDGTNANSALLVGITPEMLGNNLMAGIDFQREIEKKAFKITGSFAAPCQMVGDFLKGRESKSFGDIVPTYTCGVLPSDISLCLPHFITQSLREGIKVFAGKIHGFDRYDALLTAPETRSSSPIRILRDEEMQSNIRGLYPAGEGSGYSGGITSSAVDGIRAALKIIGSE